MKNIKEKSFHRLDFFFYRKTQPQVAGFTKIKLLFFGCPVAIILSEYVFNIYERTINMNIGEKIKDLRRKNDLTQEKLADYLNVSYQAVSKWECGLSSPDLSLIAPLTKLFQVTADELLGLTDDKSDARYTELEAAYKDTYRTGDLKERYEISAAAVNEYPADLKWLDRLAWDEACRSFEFDDQKTYEAWQEKAIRKWERVIEDCADDETKCSAIQGIVQYLGFRGRSDEARRYAELYPEDRSVSRDDVLADCLHGEERRQHIQNMLEKSLYNFLCCLIENDSPAAPDMAEEILKIIFPDKNYLHFHYFMYKAAMKKAGAYARASQCEKSVQSLEKALFHAREYDRIDDPSAPEKYKYTSPVFESLTLDTNDFCRTGSSTCEEDILKGLEKGSLWDTLRDREDFKALIKR